jgi:hypothetical protein
MGARGGAVLDTLGDLALEERDFAGARRFMERALKERFEVG